MSPSAFGLGELLLLARGLGLEGEGGGGRTLEFVFAYVDGGWGVDYVGGEVVDHDCLCVGGKGGGGDLRRGE